MAKYFEPFPAKTRNDEFGNLAPYRNGRPHRGQDWSPKENSPIKAITTGTVMETGWSDVLGNYLIHSTFDKLFVIYAHLSKPSTLKKGDKVAGGETVVGLVGGGRNTPSGSASTGAHLHLSIGKDVKVHLCAYEKLVDPLKHILANLDGEDKKPGVAAKVASAVKKVVPTKKA
jgi:murein DD-endopeptidase MepM/ murein hydrolase activator NlpD